MFEAWLPVTITTDGHEEEHVVITCYRYTGEVMTVPVRDMETLAAAVFSPLLGWLR